MTKTVRKIRKSNFKIAEVIEEKTGVAPESEKDVMPDRTPDYWCGWALCYYQWLRAIPYRKLLEAMPYEDLRGLYPTLHEADLSKFAETMDKIIGKSAKDTNLKRIRSAYGYSQSGLADKSGVSLRSIPTSRFLTSSNTTIQRQSPGLENTELNM